MATRKEDKWQGETFRLHMRSVNGEPCLFDDRGRKLQGVTWLQVTSEKGNALTADLSVFLTGEPDDSVISVLSVGDMVVDDIYRAAEERGFKLKGAE